MIEKYGGLWLEPEGVTAHECYDAKRDLIAVVSRTQDGRFAPAVFRKGERDDIHCLPWWEAVTEKKSFDSLAVALACLQAMVETSHP